MKNAVWYRDSWLMKGSQAYELFQSKEPEDRKKLERHVKELNKQAQELLTRYDK